MATKTGIWDVEFSTFWASLGCKNYRCMQQKNQLYEFMAIGHVYNQANWLSYQGAVTIVTMCGRDQSLTQTMCGSDQSLTQTMCGRDQSLTQTMCGRDQSLTQA